MNYRMYKLSKLGTLLSARMFFSYFLPYALIAVLYGAYAYTNGLAGYSVFYFLLSVVFVIHTAVRLSHKPADFTVEDRKIIFVEHLKSYSSSNSSKNIYTPTPPRITVFVKHVPSKKTFSSSSKIKPVIIRVRDIEAIKYSSNLIERIFNLGHIRIDGKVFFRDTDDSACNDVVAPDVIEISGIKNFRTVCRELETAFPHADHIGIKY